jgi:hypothetical protein
LEGGKMTEMFQLTAIRRDIACQPREHLSTDVVKDYAEAMKAGAKFPPVTLFSGPDNIYWLADGYHRVSAAESVGVTEILADLREGDRRAAILHALSANSSHGLRRSNEDKKRAVDKMLEDTEWTGWSDNRIAEHCGVSQPFVTGRRKDKSEPSVNNGLNQTRQGKDGKNYPATRKPRETQAAEYEEPTRDINDDITEFPAAYSPVSPGESAVPVEALPLPASLLTAAAQNLSAGGAEVDTREGGIAGVASTAKEEGYDPFWTLAAALKNGIAAFDEIIARGYTEDDAAERLPHDIPLFPDDLTKFSNRVVDLDVAFRILHPRGNEAAMSEEAAGG